MLKRSHFINSPRVEFIFGSPADAAKEVRGNIYSLASAIYNLILNGLESAMDKYGKDNDTAKVIVKVFSDNDKVLIAVSDNGYGIQEEDLVQDDHQTGRQKIFNLNETTKIKGTGLGTTEVYLVVKDMKGTIAIENRLGHGVTFTVILPTVDQAMSIDGRESLRKGGIDFQSGKMNLQTQNNGGEIKFHIDRAMLQKLQNAPGFKPEIINIEPMKDLKIFLTGQSNPQTAHL